MTLNRREFVGVMGASMVVVGVGSFGSASARTAAPLSSSTPVFAGGIERRSRSIGGVWRTHAWHRPAAGSKLEIIRAQDGSGISMIRLSGELGEWPREFRIEEFQLGEPQHRIRAQFGDGVLQELLEEVGFGHYG